MTKFVFVTGGVVSSLGKGIASASLAALLESRGLKVTLIKLDPYLNVDPGTMSPFQHGEVYVTEDGAETDLDLGHYERFIETRMRKANNFTTGQIYKSELKTKPTQHTAKQLREIGIQADVLLCRADRRIPQEERQKISLFSNVPEWGVISMWDVDTIYKVPRMLHEQGLDGLICDKLRLNTPPANLRRWDDLVYETEHPQYLVSIAMVGKYVDLSDSYKSLNEALRHAGMKNHAKVQIEYVDSESITVENVSRLAKFDAILVPGGFGVRGVEGKICAAQYARENKIPYLGICLGMQVATIEFARHVAGLKNANSTEFDPDTLHPVIALITEWKDADGTIKTRDAQSDLGGTMRLGAQSSDITPGTLAQQIYGDVVTERHRHRYEANVHYLDQLKKAGLIISAMTQREHLTEIVELPKDVHPWFVGVQFHPEFKSTPWAGHPLFNAYVKAAFDHQLVGKSLKVAA